MNASQVLPQNCTELFRFGPFLLLILSSSKDVSLLLEKVATWTALSTDCLGMVIFSLTVGGSYCAGTHVDLLVPGRCLFATNCPHPGRLERPLYCLLLHLLLSPFCSLHSSLTRSLEVGGEGHCYRVQRFDVPFGRDGLGTETTAVHSPLGKRDAFSEASGKAGTVHSPALIVLFGNANGLTWRNLEDKFAQRRNYKLFSQNGFVVFLKCYFLIPVSYSPYSNMAV